jgi:hypothetical protein
MSMLSAEQIATFASKVQRRSRWIARGSDTKSRPAS